MVEREPGGAGHRQEAPAEPRLSCALVVGADGALGRAVAAWFLGHGWAVVGTYRNEARRQEAAAVLDVRSSGAAGRRLRWVKADLRRAAGAERAVAAGLRWQGRIDAAVHTAGLFATEAVVGGSWATWESMLETNVRTAFELAQAVVPPMREAGGGSLVLVAARAAARAGRGMGAYAAAKSALIRLGEALADELAGSGVRVNVLAPSVIDTPANRAAMPGASREGWRTPEELAAMIGWLALPEAASVHGQLLLA
ncbi:MAG: SDR family oxidoreductase [Bacillota bacterium]|nr:SDR family oxidoreductase [Bacillota bacterium]